MKKETSNNAEITMININIYFAKQLTSKGHEELLKTKDEIIIEKDKLLASKDDRIKELEDQLLALTKHNYLVPLKTPLKEDVDTPLVDDKDNATN